MGARSVVRVRIRRGMRCYAVKWKKERARGGDMQRQGIPRKE
jgi:hypothetical protein